MTTQFFDLMCDIEAMDTAATAAIVAIAARWFDLRTQTTGDAFTATVHLGSSVADGGTMSASTVLFWLRQSDQARHSIAYNGQPVRKVLGDFSDWIAQTCRHEDVRVWGNAPSYDCVILRGAYERAGLDAPWRFYHERDFRTARAMHPQIEYDTKAKGDGAHDALVDVDFQIAHLFKIRDARKKGNQ